MDRPKRKKTPKLPPEPPGGGAAQRRRQFQKERGYEVDAEELPDDVAQSETAEREDKDEKP